MTTNEKKALTMVRQGSSYDLVERVTGVTVARLIELQYGSAR